MSDQRRPHTWPPATCPVTLLSVYLKPPDGTRPPPVPPEAVPRRQAQWVIQLQTPGYQLFLDLGGRHENKFGVQDVYKGRRGGLTRASRVPHGA